MKEVYNVYNKKELKRLFDFIDKNYDHKFDYLKNEIMNEYVKKVDCELVSWDSIEYGISTYIKNWIVRECLDEIDMSDWKPKWLIKIENYEKNKI
jgi:hypothetical protein